MDQIFNIPKVSNKLKILMVAPQPWFQPRGTPFSVLHRIKALSLLGHSVDLVTYHIGQDIPIENLEIFRAASIPGVHNIKIGPSKTKIILDAALYLKTKELAKKKKYDLLHTHEEASFFGTRLAKKYNLPHLYDMHSSLPQQLLNFKFTKSKIIRGVFEKLESKTIINANAVITICPELQSYVDEKFPQKSSILIENVADNSIVFPASNEGTDSIINQYGLAGKKIILYYGTLETYQGIDMLVASAKKVIEKGEKDAHFLMVGGNEKQINKYQQKVMDLGLKDNFSFTGFVQPQTIPALVSLSDILVSPRLRGTNSPLKIYSYLRSGKPIVATRHITHTQILNDSVSILTGPNSKDFADGIISILSNSEQKEQLVVNAKKLAEEKYSYDDYLKKTQFILEQATGAVN
jgi:glycosyltransferase involved in cell wall biosynthesis